ncbi:PEP-utilizing enzyme [Actinomadura hibisca]|uniref:PEP-utilizing enzyme n=1 Tax=Actinomadura hibisca TaxID=68565 RepID=UPI0009FD9E93|nr:PEP-utilizing enzyme [Actinomadura hibisca]
MPHALASPSFPQPYPGQPHRPASRAPDPLRPMTDVDHGRSWLLDFHWPRGLTPLGLTLAEDFSRAAQKAAVALGPAAAGGFAHRSVGTHLYFGEVGTGPVADGGAGSRRTARAAASFAAAFESRWAAMTAELERSSASFETAETAGLPLRRLAAELARARALHRRAWDLHFQVMYPLLVHYLNFQELCRDLGLDPARTATYLQGFDNRILRTDRDLWTLAALARQAGLESLFARTPAAGLAAALDRAGPPGRAWLGRLADFLRQWGHRTEGTADVNLPSWREDPTPVLGTVKTFLQRPGGFDLTAAQRRSARQRDEAVDQARGSLSTSRRRLFDEALASCHQANFAWWNDEHNFWIDLRVALPMRTVCLAIGRTLATDRPDDPLYLFGPELAGLVVGRTAWRDLAGRVEARREYFQRWLGRRPTMPALLGTVPDQVHDPVLLEIFGVRDRYLQAVSATAAPVRLSGLAAAPGSATGRARVLYDADDLHAIRPGEILVCESTSPNWTPAFGKIAACVSDMGGALSHAAIVSREYGVACVVGVGTATRTIATGDLLQVDADAGRVTILSRAT